MNRPRALVTGASGFLGARLVQALAAAGWDVRASGRRPRPGSLPTGAGYVAADLVEDDLRPLTEGVTSVFHLAGASSSLSSTEEMQRVNIEGTTRLLAAVPPDLDRFVHMSSTSVYGEEAQLALPVVENEAGTPSRSYGKAKWGAEQAVWQAAGCGLATVILRPVTVFGPGAVKLLASAALDVAIERHLGLKAVVAPRPVIEQRLVHVDDVIGACLHLAGSGAALGRAFNLASLYPSSDEVTAVLSEAWGMPWRPVEPGEDEPEAQDRRRAYDEMVAAGMTTDVLFTAERFRFLRKANLNNRLSSAALDSTGFAPSHTDLAASVGGAVDWYRRHRWLP